MTATKKHIPGKRIKTWHRSGELGPQSSLRTYARNLAKNASIPSEMETAKRWLAGKGTK